MALGCSWSLAWWVCCCAPCRWNFIVIRNFILLLLWIVSSRGLYLNISAILLTRVPVLVPLLPPMFGYLKRFFHFTGINAFLWEFIVIGHGPLQYHESGLPDICVGCVGLFPGVRIVRIFPVKIVKIMFPVNDLQRLTDILF